MVDIVFITDENYILPTKVAIRSIIRNADKNTYGTIYIICDFAVSQQNEFTELATDKIRVNIIFVTDEMRMEYVKEHEHVTVSALYKFMLPEILPMLDKVLYLDVDILVNDDLQKLFDVDIEEFYLAAVEDMAVVKRHDKTISNGKYFNSGVMLLNLKMLREENMAEKLIDERMRDKDMRFMDQTVLNRILGKKVRYLPLKYNCITNFFVYFTNKEVAGFYGDSALENADALNKNVIKHFAGTKKPWNTFEADSCENWYSYLEGGDAGCERKRCYKQLRDEIEKKTERIMLFKVRQINESFDYLLAEKQKEIDGLKALIAKYIPEAGAELNKQSDHQEKKYVIYGAGDYAMRVFEKCHAAGRENEILAFAVTDTCGNLHSIYGIPVIAIEELEGKRSKIIVIVAVSKGYVNEVLEKLSEFGFDNVVAEGIEYEWQLNGS